MSVDRLSIVYALSQLDSSEFRVLYTLYSLAYTVRRFDQFGKDEDKNEQSQQYPLTP